MISISHWGLIYVANTEFFWSEGIKKLEYTSFTEFGFPE